MVDYREERSIEWLVNHLSHSIFRVQASYALHAIRSWRIINNQNIFCQTLKWDYRIQPTICQTLLSIGSAN